MDLNLKDKTMFVLGGSTGIGFDIARLLSIEGARVTIASRSNDKLQTAKILIEKESQTPVSTCVIDVLDLKHLQQQLSSSVTNLGRLDGFVFNTGGPVSGTFTSMSENEFNNSYRLVLESAYHAMKTVVPVMQNQHFGSILFIESVSIKQPLDNLILSNVMRSAVAGLSKSLANELGPANIRVNVLCPGFTNTDRLKSLAETLSKTQDKPIEEIYMQWEGNVPLKRVAAPEEIANAAVFLLSNRASYITGSLINVDGGMVKTI